MARINQDRKIRVLSQKCIKLDCGNGVTKTYISARGAAKNWADWTLLRYQLKGDFWPTARKLERRALPIFERFFEEK